MCCLLRLYRTLEKALLENSMLYVYQQANMSNQKMYIFLQTENDLAALLSMNPLMQSHICTNKQFTCTQYVSLLGNIWLYSGCNLSASLRYLKNKESSGTARCGIEFLTTLVSFWLNLSGVILYLALPSGPNVR